MLQVKGRWLDVEAEQLLSFVANCVGYSCWLGISKVIKWQNKMVVFKILFSGLHKHFAFDPIVRELTITSVSPKQHLNLLLLV